MGNRWDPKQGRPKAEKVNFEHRYRYRTSPVSIPKRHLGNRTNGYRYRTSPVSIPRPLFRLFDFATCVDFGDIFIPRFYSELGFEKYFRSILFSQPFFLGRFYVPDYFCIEVLKFSRCSRFASVTFLFIYFILSSRGFVRVLRLESLFEFVFKLLACLISDLCYSF